MFVAEANLLLVFSSPLISWYFFHDFVMASFYPLKRVSYVFFQSWDFSLEGLQGNSIS